MAEPQQETTSLAGGTLLDAWAKDPWTHGVQIDCLNELDALAVQTRNSLYEIRILCGRTGEVLVRGGRYFPAFTPSVLSGATLGGSFLKMRGIYVGFKMEFFVDEQVILDAGGPIRREWPATSDVFPIAQNIVITSPVQTIGVVG